MSLTEKKRQELLAQRLTGILSVPTEGTAPLSSPINYSYEPGGDIRILIHERSLKARRLAEGIEVSFTVQTNDPPRWASAEGPVVSINKSNIESELEQMVLRYYGPDGLEAGLDNYREMIDEMLCVTIRPMRLRGHDLSAADADFYRTVSS